MVKRKRAPGASKQLKVVHPKWTEEEAVTLVAWLDFTLENPRFSFQDSIRARLDNSRSFEAIERKLCALWKKHGPYPLCCGITGKKHIAGQKHLTGKKDLYEHGSIVLDNPGHGMTQNFEARLSAVKKEFAIKFGTTPNAKHVTLEEEKVAPRERNLTPREQSYTLRSDSATPTTNGPPVVPFSPIPRAAARERLKILDTNETDAINPSSVLHCTSERDNLDSSSHHPSIFSDDSQEDSSTASALSGLSDKQAAPLGRNVILVSAASSQSRCENPSTTACTLAHIENQFDREEVECSACGVRQDQGHHHYVCGECMPKLESSASTRGTTRQAKPAQEELVNIELQSARTEISVLREKVFQNAEEIEDYEKAMKSRDQIISELKGGQRQIDIQLGKPFEETVSTLLGTIHALEREVDAKRNLQKFTELETTSRKQFSSISIMTGFRHIYSISSQILCSSNYDTLPFIPEVDRFPVLQALLQDLIPPEENLTTIKPPPLYQDSRLSSQQLIQALAIAALRQWVFDTDFPQFDFETSDTIAAYRGNLAIRDGALALRNLDLSVLNTLINNGKFCGKTISQKAGQLAIEFSKALASFFIDPKIGVVESDWEGFATWGEDTETWLDRKTRLKDMFAGALQTKADSCLSTEAYEMVIYPSGSQIDPRSVGIVKGSGVDLHGGVLLLCLEAALFAYPRSPGPEDASANKLMTPTKNFVRKKEGERVAIVPLIKAVAVVA